MSFVSLNKKLFSSEFFRFDGETFKTEPSTNFHHEYVLALGSYRNSPFVTGHASSTNGLKTELLDYESGEWEITVDYPFSNGDRYVLRDKYFARKTATFIHF